jgi:hypothetical protein
MTPRDFCNWMQGALSMATAEDGSVSFTEAQANKVKGLLVEALTDSTESQPQRPRPPNARC